jgi:hypothetical protein
MAELVDALVSGTSEGNLVQVRVLFRAPRAEMKVSALFISYKTLIIIVL